MTRGSGVATLKVVTWNNWGCTAQTGGRQREIDLEGWTMDHAMERLNRGELKD